MDSTCIKAIVKLAEQTEKIVKNQERIVDALNEIKQILTSK